MVTDDEAVIVITSQTSDNDIVTEAFDQASINQPPPFLWTQHNDISEFLCSIFAVFSCHWLTVAASRWESRIRSETF